MKPTGSTVSSRKRKLLIFTLSLSLVFSLGVPAFSALADQEETLQKMPPPPQKSSVATDSSDTQTDPNEATDPPPNPAESLGNISPENETTDSPTEASLIAPLAFDGATLTLTGVTAGGLEAAIAADAEFQAAGSDVSSITGLIISGALDTTDLAYIKNSLSNISVLNMGGISFGDLTDADEVFRNKTSLVSVTMPQTTSYDMPIGMFWGCTNLTSIDLGEIRHLTRNSLRGTGLISVDLSKATSFESSSGAGAQFYGCTSLETVTLPTGPCEISSMMFRKCGNLENIDLSKVTAIDDLAFGECSSLVSIDLSSLTTIGENAFNSNSKLVTVTMPSTALTLPAGVFCYCGSLQSIDLSEVKSIGNSAFCGCFTLHSVDISNVTSIDVDAFWGSTCLGDVDIPSGIIYKGGTSFRFTALDLSDDYPDGTYNTSAPDVFSDQFPMIYFSLNKSSETVYAGEPFESPQANFQSRTQLGTTATYQDLIDAAPEWMTPHAFVPEVTESGDTLSTATPGTFTRTYSIPATVDNTWISKSNTLVVPLCANTYSNTFTLTVRSAPTLAVTPQEFTSAGGTSAISVGGTGLPATVVVGIFDSEGDLVTSYNATTGNSYSVNHSFPANTSTTDDEAYTVKLSMDGGSTYLVNVTETVTVHAKLTLTADPTELSWEGGASDITATGTDLPATVKIRIYDEGGDEVATYDTTAADNYCVTHIFDPNTSTTDSVTYTAKLSRDGITFLDDPIATVKVLPQPVMSLSTDTLTSDGGVSEITVNAELPTGITEIVIRIKDASNNVVGTYTVTKGVDGSFKTEHAFPENTSTTDAADYLVEMSIDGGTNFLSEPTADLVVLSAPTLVATPDRFDAKGGSGQIIVSGNDLPTNTSLVKVRVTDPSGKSTVLDVAVDAKGKLAADFTYPENTSTTDAVVYSIELSIDGGTTWMNQPKAAVTVDKAAIPVTPENPGNSDNNNTNSNTKTDGSTLAKTEDPLNSLTLLILFISASALMIVGLNIYQRKYRS